MEFLPYITKLSSKTMPKATKDKMVSIAVHVFSVWATDILKNSLINQNPESFT
ncbi:hypothetical protein D3C85_1782840 [compost metagenome]